jgi:mono/diheme cytochrome c family protein
MLAVCGRFERIHPVPAGDPQVSLNTLLNFVFRGTLMLFLAGAPALAQDAGRGKLLYETHCLACHYERIHKRDPARSLIRTQPQLRVEVVQRAALTGRRFTVEDLDDIAEYLNRTHYKLGK